MTYIHSDGKEYGTGAVVRSPIFRKLRRLFAKKLVGAGEPMDWSKGYDIGSCKIKNQHNSFSCGGQAGSYLLENRGLIKDEISAKSVYAPIAYPQGGTTIPALINQLCKKGANLEKAVPSYYTNGSCDETLMTDKSWMTPQTLADAATRAGYTAKHVSIDIESIAQAVRDWGGAIMEIRGQNNGTWLSSFPQPPIKGRGDMWQHFMCLKNPCLINGVKSIGAFQSWGGEVGAGGVQFFQDNYIKSGHILDIFVLIPNQSPDIQPIINKSLSQRWIAFFLGFLKKK